MPDAIRPTSRHRGTDALSSIMLSKDGATVGIFVEAGASAPSNGTSGTLAGVAPPASLLLKPELSGGGKVYVNTNTQASPTWTVVGSAT